LRPSSPEIKVDHQALTIKVDHHLTIKVGHDLTIKI
jgi:hypothetical protein